MSKREAPRRGVQGPRGDRGAGGRADRVRAGLGRRRPSDEGPAVGDGAEGRRRGRLRAGRQDGRGRRGHGSRPSRHDRGAGRRPRSRAGLARPHCRHGPRFDVANAQALGRPSEARHDRARPPGPVDRRGTCRLLSIARSSSCHGPQGETELNLVPMRRIDERVLETPPLGRPADDLASAQRRAPGQPEARPAADAPHGPDAHPPKARHEQAGEGARDRPLPAPGPAGGPSQPAQVAPTPPDRPMRRGVLCLVAVMDWATRTVLAWRLSNTREAGCLAWEPSTRPSPASARPASWTWSMVAPPVRVAMRRQGSRFTSFA